MARDINMGDDPVYQCIRWKAHWGPNETRLWKSARTVHNLMHKVEQASA